MKGSEVAGIQGQANGSQPKAMQAAVPAPWVVATTLALLLGLQPLTTDLYLPALPVIAQDLGAPMSLMQLTMSALIMAFGCAQLMWGPVADRWGRRPVLLTAGVLYTLASIMAAAAPTIESLLLWRVAQGATMAAAVVCSRAMVRDLYEPVQGARMMSKGLSGLAVIALFGPALGGLTTAQAGWRWALAWVAAVGLVALLFVAFRVPETLPVARRQPLSIRPLLASGGQVLRHPAFRTWATLITCTYAGLFVMLSTSSFVYIQALGLSPMAYGGAMALGSVSYMAGTFWCRRWLGAHGMAGAVQRGAAFTMAGGLVMIALDLAQVQAAWAVLLPQCLYCFGHGIHQPCGQSGAVGPFPQAAGLASALAGFIMSMVAFGIGLLLGAFFDGSVHMMAVGTGLAALCTACVAWWLVPRHGVADTAHQAAGLAHRATR